MIVGVIGKSCRDKSFLMLYMGKVLSQGLDVCVVTRDQWFMPEVTTYEYSDRLTIRETYKAPSDQGVVIVDVTEASDLNMDLAIYLSDIDRLSVETNEQIFAPDYDYRECLYLFINALYDSKVNDRYLCHRLGIDSGVQKVLVSYLDDRDMALHVENAYNDQLAMKGLSKAYKQVILSLVAYSGQDMKTLKRWLRLAERSK